MSTALLSWIGGLVLSAFDGEFQDLAEESSAAAIKHEVRLSVVNVGVGSENITGVALDDHGLVLVLAHDIIVPGTMIASASIPRDNRPNSTEVALCTFEQVKLVGVHPRLDLALLQVSTAVHPPTLRPIKVAQSVVLNGDPLNLSKPDPGKVWVSRAVTTVGASRAGYFQLKDSTENSEWYRQCVVFNSDSQAVGLVNWIYESGSVVDGVVSLVNLRIDEFKPLGARPRDFVKARELVRAAQDAIRGLEGDQGGPAARRAKHLLRLALLESPEDARSYVALGSIAQKFPPIPGAHPREAAVYLGQALTIEPWGEYAQGGGFHEVGVLLQKMDLINEAAALWKEEVAKFPEKASLSWAALAALHYRAADYLAAGYESEMALQTSSEKPEEMVKVRVRSRDRIGAGDLARLNALTTDPEAGIRQLKDASDQARSQGKSFVLPETEAVLRNLIAPPRPASGGVMPYYPPAATPPVPKPSTQEARVEGMRETGIRGSYAIFRDAIAQGRTELAEQILKILLRDREDAIKYGQEMLDRATTFDDREVALKALEKLKSARR
jgi:tetratricopeptide (TPR) repeat protein